MKPSLSRTIIILIVFIIASAEHLFGQTKPDFSGTWVFDKIVSQPNEKMRTASVKMVIVQTPTEIKIEKLPNNAAQSGGDADKANNFISYPLGKETTLQIQTPQGLTPVKLKAEISKKGKLNFSTNQTVKTNGGDVSIKIKETFELSAEDGNTLKVKRETDNSASYPVIEMFVAKKQTNAVSDEKIGNFSIYDALNLEKQFASRTLNSKAKYLDIPAYPPEAAMNKVSGPIVVDIIFDEKGKTVYARATTGYITFKHAAVESAMKSTFEPVALDGKNIKISGFIIYDFRR